jgi:hypothetical protein
MGTRVFILDAMGVVTEEYLWKRLDSNVRTQTARISSIRESIVRYRLAVNSSSTISVKHPLDRQMLIFYFPVYYLD